MILIARWRAIALVVGVEGKFHQTALPKDGELIALLLPAVPVVLVVAGCLDKLRTQAEYPLLTESARIGSRVSSVLRTWIVLSFNGKEPTDKGSGVLLSEIFTSVVVDQA